MSYLSNRCLSHWSKRGVYDCNKWHVHTCIVLCFCQFGWTVQTALWLHYCQIHLSTMVNSFTLGTQNGTVKTKQKKARKLHVVCVAISLSDFTGHSFIFHQTRRKSTTSHENILALISRYAYQIQLSVLGLCLCRAYFQKPRYPSLTCLFSIMHHPISPTYKSVLCSEQTKIAPFTSLTGAVLVKQCGAKLCRASQTSKVFPLC